MLGVGEVIIEEIVTSYRVADIGELLAKHIESDGVMRGSSVLFPVGCNLQTGFTGRCGAIPGTGL